jgi:hypothetical protein
MDREDYLRMKAESDKLLTPDGKLLAFCPAQQELLIKDILTAAQENKDPEAWFEGQMTTYLCDPDRSHRGTVRWIDMDREDAACIDFFSQEVLFTSGVAAMIGVWGDSPAYLQPSQRRRRHQQAMADLRQRVKAQAEREKKEVPCTKYPDAFVSRNHDAFKKRAFDVAKKEKVSLSGLARQNSDTAGLGFVFAGDEHKVDQQRNSKKKAPPQEWELGMRKAAGALQGLLQEARKIVDDAKMLSRLEDLFMDVKDQIKTCGLPIVAELLSPDVAELTRELIWANQRVKEATVELKKAPDAVGQKRKQLVFHAVNVFGGFADMMEEEEKEEGPAEKKAKIQQQQQQESKRSTKPKFRKEEERLPGEGEAEEESMDDEDYVDAGPQNSDEDVQDLLDDTVHSDGEGIPLDELGEGVDSEEEDELAGRARPMGKDEAPMASLEDIRAEEEASAKAAKMEEAEDRRLHGSVSTDHMEDDDDEQQPRPSKSKKKQKGNAEPKLMGAAEPCDDA